MEYTVVFRGRTEFNPSSKFKAFEGLGLKRYVPNGESATRAERAMRSHCRNLAKGEGKILVAMTMEWEGENLLAAVKLGIPQGWRG